MSKTRRREQAARRAEAARSALPTARAILAKRDGHDPDCTDPRPHFVPPSLGDIGFFACKPPTDIRNHSPEEPTDAR